MKNENEIIAFTKVRLPYGWLGNMSPYAITYLGYEYSTAEALFQCLRFKDEEVIQEIWEQASPMAAKMKAKKHREKMVIAPASAEDVKNMAMVLMLKVDQHPQLKTQLLATGDATIIEDCTKRPRATFWGAALVDGKWKGENKLGKLWMELRVELRSGLLKK